MNKEIADALNCIIEFLAVRDLAQMSKDALKKACGASKADVIIALGSDLPVVAETACELYKAGYGEINVLWRNRSFHSEFKEESCKDS